MKLTRKLMIAFLLILIVPIALISLSYVLLNSYQSKLLYDACGISAPEEGMLIGINSVEMFSELSKKSYEAVSEALTENKESFSDEEYLDELNEKLENWYSFLAVRIDEKYVYVGSDQSYAAQLVQQFPGYGDDEVDEDLVFYTGGKTNCLLKTENFSLSGGKQGTVFVLTPVTMLPQTKSMYAEFLLCAFVILVVTSAFLVVWLYSTIIIPINNLQKATREIKNGNLNYSVSALNEDDEVSQLCMDFEEMRLRLKENSEEKIHSDEDNKELISNISHDLKSPITSIKGYCEGIMDGVASTPEKMDKYIRTIYNKANDMDKLIDELTFYSKIDSNRIPYNFAPINVVGYFEDCSEEIHLELEEKGIEMQYLNFCSPAVYVIADAEQMKRVINNIISNSVKYMDKPKGIINMRISDLGDFVQVDIEDNGRGIAAKDLPNIFDRFYRTDKARTSGRSGSGIGLSIVKKIIEDHGGQIWATSKEGTGTVMHFILRKYQNVHQEEVEGPIPAGMDKRADKRQDKRGGKQQDRKNRKKKEEES